MISLLRIWRRLRFLMVLFFGLLLAISYAPNSQKMGDRIQYVLPIAGAVCAFDKGKALNMAGHYVAGLASVHLFKNLLPDSGINLRPNGGGNGFPSGHTYSASFGAAYIARNCMEKLPVVGPIAILSAGFVGASRIESEMHNIWQVLSGAVFGLFFEFLATGYYSHKTMTHKRPNVQLKKLAISIRERLKLWRW